MNPHDGFNPPVIRRRQLQLEAGDEATVGFLSTIDLAQVLGGLAQFEADQAQDARKKRDRRHHLARREAFLEALQIVLPA